MQFDETRCTGNLLQGYTGCMCDYCQAFKRLPGTWIVNTKGGPNRRSFEVSVLRENNRHGIASYGWFDESKSLISHNGGPCQWPVPDRVWTGLVKLAHEFAEELNKQEQ